jgi:hypothetical protein
MTRYFFNYRDVARYFPDAEGGDFLDLAAARLDGRQSARELLGTERGESDPAFLGGTFEITDLAGALLATIRFDEALPDVAL